MSEIPQHLRNQGISNIVGIDFETFYSQTYSLSKLSTTEYCRNIEFYTQGVGIRSISENKTKWYTGDAIKVALRKIDWSTTAVLCHHTMFDGFVLKQHYDIVPAYYLDTKSMVRGVLPHCLPASLDKAGEYFEVGRKIAGTLIALKGIKYPSLNQLKSLGTYCKQDVDLMWSLFNILIKFFPEKELDLIDLTTRMYCDPQLQGDIKIATAELKAEQLAKQALFEQIRVLLTLNTGADAKKALGSAAQFKIILESFDQPCPIKWSEKQEKYIPAIAKNDIEFQELKEHPDEDIRLLVEARLASKSNISETRAERFINHSSTGNLPIFLNMYGAHTHRWSGGDKFNPQNFPRNSSLREAICAPEGYKLIVVDSAQVEARVLAYLAEEEHLINEFKDPNKDPYKSMAADIYLTEISAIDDVERFVGKVAVLGLGFGMGGPKFQYTLASGSAGRKVGLELEDANRIKTIYRTKNKRIVQMWYDLEHILGRMFTGKTTDKYGLRFEPNGVLMPNGLYVHYPELQGIYNDITGKVSNYSYRSRNGRTGIYGGKFTENIVQSYARSVVAEQILSIAKDYTVCLAVHDECVFLCPTERVGEGEKAALAAFRTPPLWAPGLPLDGEVKIADYYAK